MGNVEEQLVKKLAYEKRLTEYTDDLRRRSREEYIQKFAEMRNFPIETVKECGIFYIGEMAEMILPDYIDEIGEFGVISPTNNKPIFHDRYIIPIKNEQGLVQNLVGYSKEADERYIYGTAKYYRRKDTLWGLENMKKAYDMGYAILTEGITDAIRLRAMGYPNAFGNCGTHHSDYIKQQLNRCRNGVIKLPDRDNAGLRALKGWKFNRSITLFPSLKYKDTDEMCRLSENRQWFNDYMKDCINWILSDTHNGQKSICEQITII